MVKLEHIFKRIQGKTILSDVSITIPRGKLTALCGPNGAGKTTLLRIILGVLRQDEGNVSFTEDSPTTSFALHKLCLFPYLTLQQNLAFFARISNRDVNQVADLVARFGLSAMMSKKVASLSAGLSRQADILRLFLEDPALLLLDEPTANLDPRSKVEIRELLRSLVSERQCTIFFTSHLLDEVEKIADEILILDRGSVCWHGDAATLEREGSDLEKKYLEIIK